MKLFLLRKDLFVFGISFEYFEIMYRLRGREVSYQSYMAVVILNMQFTFRLWKRKKEIVVPTPEGNITSSEIWQPEHSKEELTEEEKCPCFYGGTCPQGGKHKDDNV